MKALISTGKIVLLVILFAAVWSLISFVLWIGSTPQGRTMVTVGLALGLSLGIGLALLRRALPGFYQRRPLFSGPVDLVIEIVVYAVAFSWIIFLILLGLHGTLWGGPG